MDLENGNGRQSVSSRFTITQKVLLWMAVTSLTFVTFDTLVESASWPLSVGNLLVSTNVAANASSGQSTVAEVEMLNALLPIDHEDVSRGTFRNRYWVEDKYYKRGGPVFVFDPGEGNAAPAVERFLQRPTSFMGHMLQEFHGLGILWEHRYYGESLPSPINETTPSEAFRYLTLNQSLADLPYFARGFHVKSHPDVNLSPTQVPWVIFGCSYSGGRAALSRLTYPETFFAAYAGSPVVEAMAIVDDYHEQAHRQMLEHGYSNCSKDLQEIRKHIGSQLDDVGTSSSIKQRLLGPGAEVNTDKAIADVLETLFMSQKGGGLYTGKLSLANTCNYLEWNPVLNQTTGEHSLAELYDAGFLIDRLATFPTWIQYVNKEYNTTCGQRQAPPLSVCDVNGHMAGVDPAASISWAYQQCAELGYFRPSILGSRFSPPSSLTHERIVAEQCQKHFPTEPGRALSALVERVRKTNKQFGGLNMRPSNVLWTTGEYDPYRSPSPLARSEIEAGIRSVTVTQEIPKCNVPTGPDSIFGLVLEGSVHCEVVAFNTTKSIEVRKLFADALREWFKCF